MLSDLHVCIEVYVFQGSVRLSEGGPGTCANVLYVIGSRDSCGKVKEPCMSCTRCEIVGLRVARAIHVKVAQFLLPSLKCTASPRASNMCDGAYSDATDGHRPVQDTFHSTLCVCVCVQGFRSMDEAQHFDSEWQSRASNSLMPGFGDVYGHDRSGGQQARIETPGLGYQSPAAFNNAMHEMSGQADRRSHPRYHGTRFRQI